MGTEGKTELTALAVSRENLEFVALVGNPPYSVEIGAGSALSIYPEFFEVAWGVSTHASIVSPARWLTVADLTTARGRISIHEKGIEREIRELFTHASHDTGHSLNDRSMFLSERETAKATMAIECVSVEEALSVYKFARTKLFRILVESRLSSHSTYPSAHEDVPWIFKFDESDPIDWSQSVEDIDAQLVRLFGLEEWNDFIQEVERPFANYFDEEFLEKLNKAGAYTSEIHEWYGKRLDGSSIEPA